MTEASFTIAEAARRAGVTADTVRYYERRGVLPAPARAANGYRRYTAASVQRMLLVRNALRLGFTLQQAGAFVRARDGGHPPCREVRAAAARLVEDIDRQWAEMAAARTAVVAMLADWDARLESTAPGQPAGLLEAVPRGYAITRSAPGCTRARSAVPPSTDSPST